MKAEGRGWVMTAAEYAALPDNTTLLAFEARDGALYRHPSSPDAVFTAGADAKAEGGVRWYPARVRITG